MKAIWLSLAVWGLTLSIMPHKLLYVPLMALGAVLWWYCCFIGVLRVLEWVEDRFGE